MSSRESTQKEEKRLEIWPFPHAPKWKVSKTMPWVKIMPSVINYLYSLLTSIRMSYTTKITEKESVTSLVKVQMESLVDV